MSGTPNLDLEYLDPSQAQPEVKINDAWNKIDAAVGEGGGISVSDGTTSPPIVARVREIKFEGATVTHETNGVARVDIDPTTGAGGSISVTDGTTTVTGVTEINFINGAAVSNAGGGVADVYVDPVSGGSGGGGDVTADTHPTSPMAADDEFQGLALDTAGTRRAGATPWVWVNQNGATAVLVDGALVLTEHVNGAEDVNFIVQSITTSLTAWRYRAKLSVAARLQFNNGGIMLRESGTGKICQFGLVNYSGAGQIWVEYAAGPTSGGAIAHQTALPGLWPLGYGAESVPLYLEVELAGGNIITRVSMTGIDGSFTQYSSDAQTTFFTTRADQIGLGGYSFSASSAGVLMVPWFRQKA